MQKDDPAATGKGGTPEEATVEQQYPYGSSLTIVEEDRNEYAEIIMAGKKPKLKKVPVRPDFSEYEVVGVENEN